VIGQHNKSLILDKKGPPEPAVTGSGGPINYSAA
jgi:hypothetical protein